VGREVRFLCSLMDDERVDVCWEVIHVGIVVPMERLVGRNLNTSIQYSWMQEIFSIPVTTLITKKIHDISHKRTSTTPYRDL